MNKEEFIKLSKDKYGDKFSYNYLPDEFKFRETIILCCKIHGKFNVLARDHIRTKNGCKKCSNKLKTKSITEVILDYIYKSKLKFSNKFNYVIRYDGTVSAECPDHGSFIIHKMKHHYHSIYGCSLCGREKTISSNKYFNNTEDFLRECNKIHNFKYTYKIENFKSLEDKIIINCSKHGSWETKCKSHFIWKSGCKKCNYENMTTTYDEFVVKCKAIHGDEYFYYKESYTNTNNDILIKHFKCDKTFKRKAKKHLEGQKCPYCKYSKGEEKVINFLINYEIEYVREYKFHNDKKRYDFYLPKLNLLIEYDGEQHFKSIPGWGGDERFQKQLANDKYKNKLAKKMKVDLIRISYKDYDNMEYFLRQKIIRLKNDTNQEFVNLKNKLLTN